MVESDRAAIVRALADEDVLRVFAQAEPVKLGETGWARV